MAQKRIVTIQKEEDSAVEGRGGIDPYEIHGDVPLLEVSSQETPVRYVDDVISDLKFGLFQGKMLCLTGGAYFAACAQMLVFVFLSEPIKKEWNLSEFIFPWLPFFTGIAGIIGSYIFGILSDKFGRQRPLLASIFIISVSGLASAFSPSFIVLTLFRACVSFGIGGLAAVNFVLLIEVLPRRNRGCFMVTITFCGALGAVLAGGLAWVLMPRYGWRVFVGACAVPSFIILVLRLFIPYESPRYLLISGEKSKAMDLLTLMALNNKTRLPDGDIVCAPAGPRGRLLDLFSRKNLFQTFIISFVWFFQSTGYWGVTVYLPEYMARLGVDPYFNMFCIFIGELPGLCLAMILIEPHMLGRIKCLRFFSFFTAVCLFTFALVDLDFLKAVFVICCYFCMVPIYSILNTLTPEIYNTEIRSTAMAWVNIVIQIPGLVTPFAGASLLSSNISWLYPVVWGSFFVLQFITTFGLKVETAGQNLLETNEAMKAADSQESTNC